MIVSSSSFLLPPLTIEQVSNLIDDSQLLIVTSSVSPYTQNTLQQSKKDDIGTLINILA